jgi:DNA-binding NarL/FixJ family response regulator
MPLAFLYVSGVLSRHRAHATLQWAECPYKFILSGTFVPELGRAPLTAMNNAEQAERSASQIKATSSQQAIRVMVYEGTRMGAELLARMLEMSSYPLRVIAMSEEAKAACDPILPDVDVAVITAGAEDIVAKGKLLRKLRHNNPSLRCVLLLDQCTRELVVEAFTSGAMGVCGRDESCDVLCKCIDRVHRGQVWANSEQLRYLLETLSYGNRGRLTDARGHTLLTPRQQEIVCLVVEGLRNREIANRLNISEHTIRNYLFRIFEKLGVSSRAELILYAMANIRK